MFDSLDTHAVEAELVTTAGHLAAATCRFLQLLAVFDTRQGWAGPGLRSCAHWLNWRVGMNLRTARDHLRVAHALRELPATPAAFAAGRVSYCGQEHSPGPVVEPLAARRLDALLELVAGPGPAQPAKLIVHVRLDASDDTRPRAWIDGGPAIPVSTAGRITCTAAVQALLVDRSGDPLHLGRTRRAASPQQVMALRVRDGNCCAFPGCTRTRHLEAHHLRWWRWGGRTDLDNMALLCHFHHTLIHDHGYRADLTPAGIVCRRPDGSPIPDAGPPTSGAADDLVARHTAQRLEIDDWTITPNWGAEPLDRDNVLGWLLPELQAAAA